MALALIVPDIRFWGAHPVWASLLFITWAMVYFAMFYNSMQKKYRVDDFVQDLQQADLEEKSYCHVAEQEAQELNVDNGEIPERQISTEVHQRLMIQFVKRIDFSMELLRSDHALTQDKIAEKSGFINAQSYSRAFRKMIGMPPKEWLNRNAFHIRHLTKKQ